jgi:hypothetical protein
MAMTIAGQRRMEALVGMGSKMLEATFQKSLDNERRFGADRYAASISLGECVGFTTQECIAAQKVVEHIQAEKDAASGRAAGVARGRAYFGK